MGKAGGKIGIQLPWRRRYVYDKDYCAVEQILEDRSSPLNASTNHELEPRRDAESKVGRSGGAADAADAACSCLSLIHISEPTRPY